MMDMGIVLVLRARNPEEVISMRIKERVAFTVSGLFLAGGTALVGSPSPAHAATLTNHEGVTVAVTYAGISTTDLAIPLKPKKCTRHVPGHYVIKKVKGKKKKVWVSGYWLPRGCTHR
jgi:hypothetical protein